ncbi:MAG: DedA family protein [Sinimarinibacterium sp.]|jgi:membrane protein DedA with SNARE-associated domain
MESLTQWIAALVAQLGYAEIVFLMALESSLFPVPSELVMIPAGYLAARGQLDPVLATLAGTTGSMLGAGANYVLARYAGRAFLLRYGRYLLIDARKYHEAEALFLRNAGFATFVGRLIPVIRHLISLPAGVFGMPLAAFFAITAAGAGLWCAILVCAGYYLGEPAVELFGLYVHELSIVVVIGLAMSVLWFVLRKRT